MNSSTLVQKRWNYCNVLRDDGMSYGDYVEAKLRRVIADLINEGDGSSDASDTRWSQLPATFPAFGHWEARHASA